MQDNQTNQDIKPADHDTLPKPHTESDTVKRTPRLLKPKKSHKVAVGILIGFVLAVIIGGLGAWLGFRIASNQSLLVANGIDGNTLISQEEQNVAAASAKVSPSVVSITATIQGSGFGRASEGQGAGTGLIVTADGYVMTNKHVIDGARDVTILTSDGTLYDTVTIVGSDPLNDIAFLKISGAQGLTPAVLGDSSSVRIGQSVVAIGNSLGQYQTTVTSGIISGTGRPIQAESGNNTVETLTDLLQTDAAINPGNSGGPLVNLAGQVVGINTAIAADAEGIGFAIPINATKGILKSVVESGKVERAYLGVNYVAITPEIVLEYGLSVKQGAYIFASGSTPAVVTGGPADKAGLQDKDIITKINDKEVGVQGGIASIVGEYRPGETVTATVLRDGAERTFRITLGKYE